MKASVFALGGLIILSITAANAAPKPAAAPTTPASSVACSTSGGGFGSYPAGCRNGANFKTYNECKEEASSAAGDTKTWHGTVAVWGCNSLQLRGMAARANSHCAVYGRGPSATVGATHGMHNPARTRR